LKWDEILTKKFLIKEYIKNKKHTTQIAKEIGSNHTTVANYLRKYNIRIRSKSETMRGSDNPMFGVDMKGEKSPSYIDGRSSKKHPCIEPGCKNMVHYTTAFFDGGRCRSCARREQYKDPRNHPNWHDGSSFEPYPLAFTEKLRRQIRKRDNHICQLCGRTEKQNNRALSVHHIDYNKENCSERNLISLCKYCHTKVNADRNYWTSYFKQKTLQLSTV